MFQLGGREDVEVFIDDVVYWYVLVGWELLGNKGDFTDVLIATANIFGDIWQDLFPSFKHLRPEGVAHFCYLCFAGGVC